MTDTPNDTSAFARLESEVRSYCRSFPTVFATASGPHLTDEGGRTWIDFFAGAGSLNYGHNPPDLQQALVSYLTSGGVTHSLDMHTVARRRFLERFDEVVLKPRDLRYKMLFGGPTGTNAVEAALKLARKVTGRQRVVSFTNGFHGMTLGSLALTGNRTKRDGAGVSLEGVSVMPFDGYLGDEVDTVDVIERMLDDGSSGLDLPAAFVVETIQAEGGIHVASAEWLQRLAALAKRFDALLVVDDIQVGCGRTGPFFSFEGTGVVPDMITMSKSLSGYGLPLSMVLVKPEHDQFAPGEHNGTFRGHNPAFVTAAAALERWTTPALSNKVAADADHVAERLVAMAPGAEHRGRGLIQGLVFPDPAAAGRVSHAAFERGLIIETAGPDGEVLKLLPPLTIDRQTLDAGLDIIEASIAAVGAVERRAGARAAAPTPVETSA
ncbi:MAG: diaminobutyrate--2-oxoglutarate transaminase [Myxococcota bacterium]